jgi:hypothetical protein
MQTPMAHPKRSLFAAAIACAVGVGLLLVACERDEAPTEVPPIEPPSIISDGAQGGNPDFFFLPPLVPNPVNHPDFHNPDEADEFNGDLIPVVEICQLTGDPSDLSLPPPPVDCVSGMAPVKRFAPDEAQQVEVMYDEEHYLALWHTDESNLSADEYYRIRVFVGGVLLGFADVDVVNSGRELKNVITGEFVPLRDDRTLPIKFRIEQGALCDPGATLCSERTLDASQGGALILMDPAAHEPGDWDRFDVEPQPGGVFEVLDEEGDPDTTSFVTFSMEHCGEGFLGNPVSECLKIESKPQILRFAELATVSFCEVEEQDPTTLLTIYQKHDSRVIPIPHADDKCSLNIGRSESSGLMRFADAGWRLIKRPLARVFVPQPLVASAPVVMHRGKGGLTGSTSLFEIGAPPDKFPGLISWWTGDGHFKDIYGAEVESDRNDGAPAVDFSEPLDAGVVHFAAGIIDSAFDFHSSADFVRVTTGYGITDRSLTELTLAAWVKLNSLAAPGDSQRFVTIAPPGTETAMLRNQRVEEGPDELHFAMKFDLEGIPGIDGCDGYGFCHINVSNVLTAGSCFHHVAGTYGADGYMRLYLDGVEVGSLDVGATPVSEGDQGFAISSPDEPLDGLIDDVVVYSVALTASQIAEIRGEDATGKCEPPVLGPTLLEPDEGAVIQQNRDDIGCSLIPWYQGKGYGFEIEFDWSDVPDAATYELETWREGSDPGSIVVDGSSSYTSTECNTYVVDNNLQGWMWRVRAVDALGNASQWSQTGTYEFAPCRLSDGSACVSPPLSVPRLYGVRSGDNDLTIIDIGLLSAVPYASLGSMGVTTAMAKYGDYEDFYVWGNQGEAGGELFSVNRCDADVTLLATFPRDPLPGGEMGELSSLAYAPDGTLYGIGNEDGGGQHALFLIDDSEGWFKQQIAALDLRIFGADFGPDDQLYGVTDHGDRLVTVNTDNGTVSTVATFSPALAPGAQYVGSVVFDSAGDLLVATSAAIYRVSGIGGTVVVENLGAIVSGYVAQGLAFAPAPGYGCVP